MFRRILIATLVTGLVITCGSHDLAEAGKRRKTVTRSFSSTGQIAIPNDGVANPYPSTLQVGGIKKGKIKDVNVTLRDFSHNRPDHVDILLVAPNGSNTLIMSDVGGADPADNLTIVLDDEALAALPLTSQLTSGTFRPTSDGPIDSLPAPAPVSTQAVALSVFNGAKPNGQWQLFVRDDTNGQNGDISGGWTLEITAKVKKRK